MPRISQMFIECVTFGKSTIGQVIVSIVQVMLLMMYLIDCSGDDAEADDSDEDSGMTVSAEPTQEELYIEDPKKALRGFFEREGRYFYFTYTVSLSASPHSGIDTATS